MTSATAASSTANCRSSRAWKTGTTSGRSTKAHEPGPGADRDDFRQAQDTFAALAQRWRRAVPSGCPVAQTTLASPLVRSRILAADPDMADDLFRVSVAVPAGDQFLAGAQFSHGAGVRVAQLALHAGPRVLLGRLRPHVDHGQWGDRTGKPGGVALCLCHCFQVSRVEQTVVGAAADHPVLHQLPGQNLLLASVPQR